MSTIPTAEDLFLAFQFLGDDESIKFVKLFLATGVAQMDQKRQQTFWTTLEKIPGNTAVIALNSISKITGEVIEAYGGTLRSVRELGKQLAPLERKVEELGTKHAPFDSKVKNPEALENILARKKEGLTAPQMAERLGYAKSADLVAHNKKVQAIRQQIHYHNKKKK